MGEVLPGDSLTVVLDPDFAVEGILEPGQAEMPAHGRVLHAVFQDIEQGLRRPVRIAAAAGGGIPVIKQGLGFQLDRDEKRGRGLSSRERTGTASRRNVTTPASSLDIFSSEETSHWIRSSWARIRSVNSSPFRGGKLCVLEQVGHDHHGGQRRLELMGDIGEGVGKLGFFPLQQAGVFREHDRHFVEFALQNAQFALLVVPHVQEYSPGRYPLEIARQLPRSAGNAGR